MNMALTIMLETGTIKRFDSLVTSPRIVAALKGQDTVRKKARQTKRMVIVI